MTIAFYWHRMEPDKNLEGAILERLAKLDQYLGNFNEELKQAELKIHRRSRWGYKVSFDMQLPGRHIYATERNEDLLLAVTSLREEVERQLKEYRRRLEERR